MCTAVSKEIVVLIIRIECILKMREELGVPLKGRSSSAWLHGLTLQRTEIFIHTTKRNTSGKSYKELWQSKGKEIHGHYMLV